MSNNIIACVLSKNWYVEYEDVANHHCHSTAHSTAIHTTTPTPFRRLAHWLNKWEATGFTFFFTSCGSNNNLLSYTQ